MATSRTAGRRYRPRPASKVDIFSNLFTDFVDTRQHALFYDLVTYDTIIRNGRWFDGTGAPSAVRNIGIRDGHVVAISPHDLDDKGCPRVIDATGKWVLPGMLDIHTHYDVEVLNGPSLSESLRHGVTTVMLGSCSLSTVHVDGVDAGDIFGRRRGNPPRTASYSAVDDRDLDERREGIQAWKTRSSGRRQGSTGELADWASDRPAVILRIGDRADLVVIDPEHLDAKLDDYAEDRVEQYGGLSRMVNRNDDTVNTVFVGGRAVFLDGKATDLVGKNAPGASCVPRTRLRHCPLKRWSSQVAVEDTVLGMWKALSARDWDSLKTFLSDDCVYLDMPVGPTAAARGPEDIVKRLKIGLEPLASYENFDGLMLDNGTDVMFEHHEEWHWPTGESAVLKFVSVHRVENGKITLWKDYWDMGALANSAPPTWMEDIMNADMSWVFDATGLV